ncbi:SDR family oxidoreductase [Paenibacillus sinopodophylli]|uniref:SDR family oxidoreductase n=1 Tax=Paenibacillus sinopodophylli TaxID=1837342 RepID=UPI001FE44E25
MGLVTAVELAKLGAHVILICRSRERGQQALEEVKKQSGSTKIDLMLCDLGSFASIRSFAAAFKQSYQQLDVLINNAGVVSLKRQLTVDGHESQLGVNHLGHFLLTNELLDLIKRAPQGRIINLSSGAHKAGSIHFNDPTLSKGYNVVKGYAQSKLANVLFTKELARRLSSTSVTVNCVHPGAVATSLGVDRKTGFGKSVHRLLKPFFRTPLEGAATAIYLASSEEAAGLSGHYWVNNQMVPTSSKTNSTELTERFWIWSEQQVGLT